MGTWVLRHRWVTPLWREYRSELARIHPADGFDEREVRAVGQIYLAKYVTGCGATMPPKKIDGVWVAQLRVGAAGTMSADVIRIDARTGAVSSSRGPAFSSYDSFRRRILWGI